METAPSVAWRPALDEELTWLRVDGGLPLRPRPLEYTCTVASFAWGLTQALRESFWPLYALRTRLIEGRLYLAAVPSPHAERDLENRVRLMRETPLRHVRNIRAAWERDGLPEVERYDAQMEAFPPDALAGDELGEAFFHLKRARADQWCATLRVAVCPTVMIRQGIGETPIHEAMAVVKEVVAALQRGDRVFATALQRAGERLARAGCIGAPEDVGWLEYAEMRAALERGGAYHPRVAQRRSSAADRPRTPPPVVGPPLSPDAPPLYLLPDVLELIGVECAW